MRNQATGVNSKTLTVSLRRSESMFLINPEARKALISLGSTTLMSLVCN